MEFIVCRKLVCPKIVLLLTVSTSNLLLCISGLVFSTAPGGCGQAYRLGRGRQPGRSTDTWILGSLSCNFPPGPYFPISKVVISSTKGPSLTQIVQGWFCFRTICTLGTVPGTHLNASSLPVRQEMESSHHFPDEDAKTQRDDVTHLSTITQLFNSWSRDSKPQPT